MNSVPYICGNFLKYDLMNDPDSLLNLSHLTHRAMHAMKKDTKYKMFVIIQRCF